MMTLNNMTITMAMVTSGYYHEYAFLKRMKNRDDEALKIEVSAATECILSHLPP